MTLQWVNCQTMPTLINSLAFETLNKSFFKCRQVEEVWMHGLNYHKFWRFLLPVDSFVFVRLRRYIKHTRKCFIAIQTPLEIRQKSFREWGQRGTVSWGASELYHPLLYMNAKTVLLCSSPFWAASVLLRAFSAFSPRANFGVKAKLSLQFARGQKAEKVLQM